MRWLKQQLRSAYLHRRLNLDSHLQTTYSLQIAQRLFRSDIFQQAQHIALYSAFKGEVSTTHILQMAQRQDKSCYLPVLKLNKLAFIKVDAKTQYQKNAFGILEPIFNDQKQILAQNLDLALLPLVAFDNQGYRLGMGKGYYDTTFAFKRSATKPKLVGLAYDFQRVRSVPHGKLDIKLEGVMTEKRTYLFPRNQA